MKFWMGAFSISVHGWIKLGFLVFSLFRFFTARRSYVSAVLGVVILSVRPSVRLSVRPSVSPSVTRVLCD